MIFRKQVNNLNLRRLYRSWITRRKRFRFQTEHGPTITFRNLQTAGKHFGSGGHKIQLLGEHVGLQQSGQHDPTLQHRGGHHGHSDSLQTKFLFFIFLVECWRVMFDSTGRSIYGIGELGLIKKYDIDTGENIEVLKT